MKKTRSEVMLEVKEYSEKHKEKWEEYGRRLNKFLDTLHVPSGTDNKMYVALRTAYSSWIKVSIERYA